MIPTKISLLGYNVFSGSLDFFSCDFGGVVNAINPHSYVIARSDLLFQQALMASDFLIPDGVGILIAAKAINGTKINKISGTDLHRVVLKSLNEKKGRCFYLGSSDSTLDMIRKRMEKESPEIAAGFYSPPYKQHFTENDSITMVNAVNEFAPDVLFVGMTAPKQEKWVFQNRHRLSARVICCIGAVFDFYAGNIKRPDKFWISIGLEWLPRLINEPVRLWRRTFISSPLFLMYVLQEKADLVFKVIKNKKSHL